jgi:uncharacterized membrane protein YcaP (DUF421 family)
MERVIIALLGSIVVLKIFDKDVNELIFILYALLGLVGYKKVQIFRYKRNTQK